MFIHIHARLMFSCNNIARVGLQNTNNMHDDRLIMLPQTTILEGRTNISECAFEALFNVC